MSGGQQAVRELTREFYRQVPDYRFCRALAENVHEGNVAYPQALQHLARKRETQRENREVIRDKLNGRALEQGGRRLLLRQLTLRQILKLDDDSFQEVVKFYFDHPYAHRRTLRSRWVPRWMRSFFLRVLFGHARGRQLPLNYAEYHEILTLL